MSTHTHSAPEVGPRGVYNALLKGRSDHEWDREYTQQITSSLIAADCTYLNSSVHIGPTQPQPQPEPAPPVSKLKGAFPR